jgi:hypothetical protein
VEDELDIEDSGSDDSEGETTPPGSVNTRSTASDQDFKFDDDFSSSGSEDKEQTDSGSTVRVSTVRSKAQV